MADGITKEEFWAMKAKMDEAENDDTPYAVTTDDGISVVGDVNKTEITKHDYTVLFYYPNSDSWKSQLKKRDISIVKYTPNYIICKKTYKDVWIPPRVYTAVQATFVELYRFFHMITEGGELRELSEQETIIALRMLGQDMIETMVHAVATILRIPPEEEDFIYAIGLPALVIQMIDDFPEVVNGVDFFTDKSSETSMGEE